jgi:hypothetical protein
MQQTNTQRGRIERSTDEERTHAQDAALDPIIRAAEAVADNQATCGALGCREEHGVSLVFGSTGRSRVLCSSHAQDYLGEGKA